MKKFILSIFSVSVLAACGYAPPINNVQAPASTIQSQYVQPPVQSQYVQPPVQVQVPPPVQETKKDKDKDKNKDKCKDDESCQDICDDIFKSSYDKKRCGKLTEDEVEDFEDVFAVIKKPDDDNLDDLSDKDLESLEKLIDISINPVMKEIRSYKTDEVREFMIWLVEDSDVTELFRGSDDNFQILDTLLRKKDSDTVEAIGENLDRHNDSFLVLAITSENEEALDWIHEYLEEGSNSDNKNCDDDNKCIFDKYCRIYEGNKNDFPVGDRKDFKEESSEFADLLDELVESKLGNNVDYESYCTVGADGAVATDSNQYKYRTWSKEGALPDSETLYPSL